LREGSDRAGILGRARRRRGGTAGSCGRMRRSSIIRSRAGIRTPADGRKIGR
jgi:hypothetical protein